jgi:hypothetical protein
MDTLEVEVMVEVKEKSSVGDLTREHSACRSTVTYSVLLCLTCLAVYITALLVLPMKVAHPVIYVEGLTMSSLEENEVMHLMQELELGVGEALRISLSEVCTRYFGDSDAGSELVEEQNYRDVIENHTRSGRYMTKDIDGIPFAMYDSDA